MFHTPIKHTFFQPIGARNISELFYNFNYWPVFQSHVLGRQEFIKSRWLLCYCLVLTISFIDVFVSLSTGCSEVTKFAFIEVKHHVYVKRQTRICTTWPSFPITCRLLFIISTHELVVSHNFLSIRIVWSCFYLLIFYFEIFSTWIWRLPFTWSLNSLIINLNCLPNVNQPFLINHSYWKQLRFALRLSKSQFESVALFRDFVDQKSGLKGKTSLKRND